MIGVRQDYSLGPYISPYPSFGLLRHALNACAPGYAIELGVGVGDSTRIIAERMPVVGFDSFAGLPEDWREDYPKGTFSEFKPPAIANTRLVIGWFADTLPTFDWGTVTPISLIHFDADLYSSTKTALKHVGPYITTGCVCVFDEWAGYDGCEQHEQRAWREYATEAGLTWQVLGHSDQEWAIRIA